MRQGHVAKISIKNANFMVIYIRKYCGIAVDLFSERATHRVIYSTVTFLAATRVTSQVSQVVLLFQTCGMGTHACLKGLAAIRELIGDIETTTTLFSTTSALHLPAAEQGESFGQYRWVCP